MTGLLPEQAVTSRAWPWGHRLTSQLGDVHQHQPCSGPCWLQLPSPLSAATGGMPASLAGSTVTSKCIPRGQLGIPLQVDQHEAMSRGHFPSQPGTARAPAEHGQAWGGCRARIREALVPIPRGCGDARGTISLGDCLHRSLSPDSAGFVTTGRRSSFLAPHARWQEEGEAQLPWHCRQLVGMGQLCPGLNPAHQHRLAART